MPTYVYLGHGRDLVTKISGPDEPEKWNVSSIETVPEGCTYATISETGDNVPLFVLIYLSMIAGDPIKKQLLMKPKENFYEIRKLLRKHAMFSTYHFKLPGNKYINRICDFLLSFKNRDETIDICRSGLYDIEKSIDPPLHYGVYTEIKTHPLIDKQGKEVILDNGKKIQVLTIGDIKQIYKDSIFPTIDNILSEIKKLDSDSDINDDNDTVLFSHLYIAVRNIVNEINQRDLLERFPGNHFNFSCRGYGVELTPARIRQLRRESKRQIYNLPSPFMQRLRQFNPFRRKTKVAPIARKGRKNRTRKV